MVESYRGKELLEIFARTAPSPGGSDVRDALLLLDPCGGGALVSGARRGGHRVVAEIHPLDRGGRPRTRRRLRLRLSGRPERGRHGRRILPLASEGARGRGGRGRRPRDRPDRLHRPRYGPRRGRWRHWGTVVDDVVRGGRRRSRRGLEGRDKMPRRRLRRRRRGVLGGGDLLMGVTNSGEIERHRRWRRESLLFLSSRGRRWRLVTPRLRVGPLRKPRQERKVRLTRQSQRRGPGRSVASGDPF